MHGLLLVILFASAAFQGEPAKPDFQLINIIPSTILDKAGVGGGNPEAAVTPQKTEPIASKPAEPVLPQKTEPIKSPPKVVDPPKPAAKKIEPTVEDFTSLRPIKEATPLPVSKPTRETKTTTNPPKKIRQPGEIKVDLGQRTTVKDQRAQQRAQQEADATAYNAGLAKQVGKVRSDLVHSIGSKTAVATVVGKIGQGGGEAYAGYENIIGSIYYKNWNPPDGTSDSETDTEVEIVVARDGSIVSADIVSKSGRSAMDKSVATVLKKVHKLPPFPEGAQDAQRTFQIVFNLKAKQSTG